MILVIKIMTVEMGSSVEGLEGESNRQKFDNKIKSWKIKEKN